MLLTRLPLDLKEASFLLLSFDLHVLSTPPAFVLSQDQTLHDRSFVWLDYFLPCSNSLLGIATSHIGLIRSLYCSVFKEPSLFKRLDYLTTFISFCQMFFEIFFKVSFSFGFSICLCSPLCRATYEIISHLLLSVNWLFLRSFGLRLTGSRLKRVLLYQFVFFVSRVFYADHFQKCRITIHVLHIENMKSEISL